MNKIISVKNLTVKFLARAKALTAIRNISFDIYDGEIVAIVGESGSGKSVFTKTFTNMLESNGWISDGSITYYPNNEAVVDPIAKIKEPKDLVEYHKSLLANDSVRRIIKQYKSTIKYAKQKMQKMNAADEALLESDIKTNSEKLTTLQNQINFSSSNKNAHAISGLQHKIAKAKKELALAKDKKQKELKLAELEKTIANAERQIVLLRPMSVLKKWKVARLISSLKKYEASASLNEGQKNKFETYYKECVYLNGLEKLIYDAYENIKDDKKIPEPLFAQIISKWNTVKSVDFINKLRAQKSITELRGGTIATIFQDPMTSLNPLLSVGYQITEAIRNHRKMSLAAAKQEAIALLEKVGIQDAKKRYKDIPGKYSGGMRQRVVIAIALACRPKILICDEPTTALDVTVQAQVLKLIKDLQAEYKFTTIFITHDLGVVANIADRVAVMYSGQIIEYGTANEIFFNAQHPYTWALLSSLPQLGKKGEELYSIPGTPPSLFKEIKGEAYAPRNEYALKIDYLYEPPFFKVTNTHYAKTWLLDPRAPKLAKPKQLENLKQAVADAKVGE